MSSVLVLDDVKLRIMYSLYKFTRNIIFHVTSQSLASAVKTTFFGHCPCMDFNLSQPLRVMHLCIMHAKIHTDHGSMTVEFFENDAPNTVANFVKLAKEGFYEGLKFHRVIPGFVAQGGCPQGIGSGGPGYTIDCELDGDNQHHDKGVLSMAHAGRNTGGSQFFIVHNRENTAHLDRNHTCFGKVTEGLELVEEIKQGDTFRVEIIDA